MFLWWFLLQDALFTAPAMETADYHSSLNPNSFFYVFDHQTKGGLYKQVKNEGWMFGHVYYSGFIEGKKGRAK